MLFDLLLANPQGLDRAAHRGTAQPPRSLEAHAQLHRLGKTVHDVKLTALWLGNQHAARIRTQIERRIKRAVTGIWGKDRKARAGVIHR